MKILSWNVRGLGDPGKKATMKNFIKSIRPDILCFPKFKLDDPSNI